MIEKLKKRMNVLPDIFGSFKFYMQPTCLNDNFKLYNIAVLQGGYEQITIDKVNESPKLDVNFSKSCLLLKSQQYHIHGLSRTY